MAAASMATPITLRWPEEALPAGPEERIPAL